MRKLILIGDERSKGCGYFARAAAALDVPVQFLHMPYGDEAEVFAGQELSGNLVKLDPPRYDSADILKADDLIRLYRGFLHRLEQRNDIWMLNSPRAILDTLDKRQCKAILSGTGVAITPVLADNIRDMRDLKALMLKARKYRVFIKPVYGSGAGGVLAYRIHPGGRGEVLYTSAYVADALPHDRLTGDPSVGDMSVPKQPLRNRSLLNTKKLRKYEDPEQIARIGDLILGAGAVVEEWMPKARHGEKAYDLRVVYQFGRIHYAVARQSGGPITNLHLNNDALPVSELGLTAAKMAEIEALCGRAAAAFPGLNVVGIDVLLTPKTLTPYIIEMNAQGDLIYQDIYNENRVYRAQVEYMAAQMTRAAGK